MTLDGLRTIAAVLGLIAILTLAGITPYWWGSGAGIAALTAAPPDAPPKDEKATAPNDAIWGDNYVVFTARTDLHRLLIDGDRAGTTPTRAFVAVDGMSIIRPDGALDPHAVDFAGLRTALKPYRASGAVLVNVCYFPEASKPATNMLAWAMCGFVRNQGFQDVSSIFTCHNDRTTWKSRVNAKRATGADTEETAVGNDLVRVYPVQSLLSGWLTNQADCVVEILRPYRDDDEGIRPDMRQAIGRYLDQLQLPGKDIMFIRVTLEGKDRDTGVTRFRARGTEAFVQSLGFRNYMLQAR
jgi:hypothetical protein